MPADDLCSCDTKLVMSWRAADEKTALVQLSVFISGPIVNDVHSLTSIGRTDNRAAEGGSGNGEAGWGVILKFREILGNSNPQLTCCFASEELYRTSYIVPSWRFMCRLCILSFFIASPDFFRWLCSCGCVLTSCVLTSCVLAVVL